MFKRLLIIAASTAVLVCLLASCGDDGAGSGEPLRWRSAVDVPVNFSIKVDLDDPKITQSFPKIDCGKLIVAYPELSLLGLDCDSVKSQDSLISFLQKNKPELLPNSNFILDIDSGTVSTASDVMDFLRKLDSTKIEYEMWVKNDTKAALTVYGMFFRKDDREIKNMKDTAYYNIIKDNKTKDGQRVNILDTMGMYLNMGSTGYVKSKPEQGKPLGDLIIRQKAFSYRWLVKFDKMDKTAVATDTVKIRLRIGFSGLNSMDSLFTL